MRERDFILSNVVNTGY